MPKTFSLFRNNKFNKDFSYPTKGSEGKDFPKPIDFWYEKTLYGRVDERQNPIYISFSIKRFKQIHPSKQIFALNFVADAFFSFQRHIGKANSTGKLALPSVLVSLEPKKAFLDIESAYGAHKQTIIAVMIDGFLSLPQHNDDVENFDDFVNKFVEFFEKNVGVLPITRSAYIKSQDCSPLISGLVIDLADKDHSDDKIRKKWISDPNYEFYTKEAKKFGFIVDKYAPWRLVADIASPRMQNFMNPVDWPMLMGSDGANVWPNKDYASPSGLSYTNTVRTLFDHYYTRSYKVDMLEMQELLVDTYTEFYKRYPTLKKIKTQQCSDQLLGSSNKITTKIIRRQDPSDRNSLIGSYSYMDWANLYFSLRLEEENMKINQKARERIISSFTTLDKLEDKKKVDEGYALWYLNQAVKGFPKLLFPVTPFEFLPFFCPGPGGLPHSAKSFVTLSDLGTLVGKISFAPVQKATGGASGGGNGDGGNGGGGNGGGGDTGYN